MSIYDREKWNARYADEGAAPAEPSKLVVGLAGWLPKSGRALDVAGGAGRHAIWFAEHGLDTTLTDISENGLRIAETRARDRSVPLDRVCLDLQEEPFPRGPWNLILSFYYLCRPLFSEFRQSLAPGGLLVVVQGTRRNLERHEKPPATFLFEEGELPRLAQGLTVLRYEEGWLDEGRHEALLIARRD